MQLSAFLERDTAPLHKDVAIGLTKFEKNSVPISVLLK